MSIPSPTPIITESSGSGSSSHGPFGFGTRLGIVFIVEAACLSLAAVLGLLAYIAYAAVKLRRDARRRWDTSTPLHWYFLSMLIAEIIQATGSIMDLKWIIKADVVDGPFCTAQGILKNIGDVSVALSTLAIAIHTFRAIVFRWHPENPHLVATLVLISIWIIVVLIMAISAGTHKGKQYWGDTQYWCWITSRYPVQQIVLDYLFMWTTAFVNIVLYIPLALVIKGIIIVEGKSFKLPKKSDRMDVRGSVTEPARGIDSIAMQMFFYPLLYTITVLPIAIVRFRAFHDQHVPFAATVVADVLFSSSGLFNVILFSCTRPSLLPARRESMFNQQMSFSTRGRVSDPEHGRQSMIMTRATIPGNSDLNLDDSWGKHEHAHEHMLDTLEISSKGRQSPSFTSYRSAS